MYWTWEEKKEGVKGWRWKEEMEEVREAEEKRVKEPEVEGRMKKESGGGEL